MDYMLDKERIKALPKIELHCHLDGSIPIATLEKLAKKENLPLEQLQKAVAPKKCLDLKEYLESFDIILPLLQSEENLSIAAYDLIEQVSKENICYIEIRFAPLLHQQNNLSIGQIISAVLQGIYAAQKKFDVHANLLISAMRHHTEKQNFDLITGIKNLNIAAIVGFDFAGDEQQVSNQEIKQSVLLAINSGLKLTLHSGECGCAQNVIEAIHLGATRIGHGIAIKDSLPAMQYCADNNILLELCPTSNIQTNAIRNWQDYPLRLFLENGVKCCINTDNRTVSQTTLTDEYLLLAKHCSLNFSEMMQLNLNAVNGCFAKEEVKLQLIHKIKQSYDQYIKKSDLL
ncbi:adenosine deaminase [Erysipelotrichaceae bacterium]|nr:adenosine deaminase [Erysipelotrichaceae bacterium]